MQYGYSSRKFDFPSWVPCLAILLVLFPTIALSAGPGERTPLVGGNGGSPFATDCAEGAVLAGLGIRSGAAIDQVSALCVAVNDQGRWLGEPYVGSGESYGGGGGGPSRNVCPRNQAVVNVLASTGAGRYANVVGYLEVRCQPLTSTSAIGGQTTTLSGQGILRDTSQVLGCESTAARGLHGRSGGLVDTIGLSCAESAVPSNPVPVPLVGGAGGSPFDTDCGEGAVLAGLDMRSGSAIDQVGALCVNTDDRGRWQGEPYAGSGTPHGGGGGGPSRSLCPRDQAVVDVFASAGAGRFAGIVGYLEVRCQPLTSIRTAEGQITSLPGRGLLRGEGQLLSCETTVARGIKGRSGGLLDSIGLICADADGGPTLAETGEWSTVIDWPMIGIHSVLTPQGEVLTFGTDAAGVQGAQFFYDVWNPDAGFGDASHATLENTLGVDLFCSAPLIIPETGNILMPGGDARFGPGGTNNGIVDAPVFDPISQQLDRAADMSFARWYPTSTTLPSGEILLVGGRDDAGLPATTPEIYAPGANEWRTLFGARSEEVFGALETRWWYPRQWVAPDGRIFGMTGSAMYYLSTTGAGDIERVGTVPASSRGYDSTAVMFAPGQILQVGGTDGISNGAFVVDINGSQPVTREVTGMSQDRRSWGSSSVLPDGTVLLTGGSVVDNQLQGSILTAELWDPQGGTWTSLADSALARLYHSTSLLLPDGRVLIAGGGAPGPLTNTNVEVFSPPYLFNANGNLKERFSVSNAPAEASYGSTMTLDHDSAKPISRVTLIKSGAVTHSFNMEQRFMDVDFTQQGGQVTLQLPSSASVAPPGYYMVFLLDSDGTPAKAPLFNLLVP